MKKSLSILLSTALLILCGIPAFASADTAAEKPARFWASSHSEPLPALESGLIADVLDALGSEIYRDTYDALRKGETITTGSYGSAARGLQQMLNDFGQNIGVDGSVGPMTMVALGTVQEIFGLEKANVLDADGFAQLLAGLLMVKKPDLADDVLPKWMDADRYTYLQACALEQKGERYAARMAFERSGYSDWEKRAAACVLPQPASGELWKDPALGSGVVLNFAVDQPAERGMHIKIYQNGTELVSVLFVKGPGRAAAYLPSGSFTIKDGTGLDWYGLEDSFGDDGYYEIMTFDDGSTEVNLEYGYSYTISINVQSESPEADDVGAISTTRDEF